MEAVDSGQSTPVSVVLFDRDGTLVVDVPYNGDPDAVVLLPRVVEAIDLLCAAGLAMGVISNQSGIARGILEVEAVQAVNARVRELLPALELFLFCPHGPEDRCLCRKPQPQMVVDAATQFGVHPSEVVVIGDIGADVEAARAAGARGILVPTDQTLPEEISAAPEVAEDLYAAALSAVGRS